MDKNASALLQPLRFHLPRQFLFRYPDRYAHIAYLSLIRFVAASFRADAARTCLRLLAGVAAFTFAHIVTAAQPVFGLPIQCRLGIDCHIQNFVDRDPGPGWRDYACGSLSYDGHLGTDFRLPDRAAMDAGVNVLAAASGVVVAVRDGEPDIAVSRRGRAALAGKDAGNSVRITHEDGWETQYSHMKRGSVLVRPGQRVTAGTVLGQVGLSGNTEFPHVDFAVRHEGRTVDPFMPDGGACGTGGKALWAAALEAMLAYRATGLLTAGLAPLVPERDDAEAGSYASVSLAPDATAITFWMELFGLQKGDVLELRLVGPDGQTLATSRSVAPGDKAVWFAFAGKRRGKAAWRAGTYTGQVVLRRGAIAVIEAQRSAVLNVLVRDQY